MLILQVQVQFSRLHRLGIRLRSYLRLCYNLDHQYVMDLAVVSKLALRPTAHHESEPQHLLSEPSIRAYVVLESSSVVVYVRGIDNSPRIRST